MNTKLGLSSITLVSLLLASCNPSEPSDEYPNGILFQNIDIFIDDDSIQVSTDLSSNGDIYLSANREYQYLTINDGEQYPLQFITNKDDYNQQDNITTIYSEVLAEEIQANDEVKVVFSRANGSILESWAKVPEDVLFESPLADEIYDHSSEDLVISWQSQTIEDTLFLTGDCLAYDASAYINTTWGYLANVTFSLNSAQTSLTIPANSLLSINGDNTQCEITISLYPISYGSIDENLAGGSYTLQKQSSLRVTLTNLRETYDE